MIILAIDTSDTYGSVAVQCDGKPLSSRVHSAGEDYSSWLLPAVFGALAAADSSLERVDVLAVCTGPGSFTGIRVGLTTVKAWSEIYGRRIVGMSRLEALARNGTTHLSHVLACYDAQRGQDFATLYRREEGVLTPVGPEMVATPEEILQFVAQHVGSTPVEWLQLGGDTISNAPGWTARAALGDALTVSSLNLAATIAQIAQERAAKNQFTNVLLLDANYVRRSDAEIFWKGPAKRVP